MASAKLKKSVRRKSLRKSPRKSAIKRRKIGSGKEIARSSPKIPKGYVRSGGETDLRTGKRTYFFTKWKGKYDESTESVLKPKGRGWKIFMTAEELSEDIGKITRKNLWYRIVSK